MKMMSAIEQATDISVHYGSYSACSCGCISKIALYFRYTPNIFVMFHENNNHTFMYFSSLYLLGTQCMK
jgi:hypothetical protein